VLLGDETDVAELVNAIKKIQAHTQRLVGMA
jgi:hypothetical protein